jgi:ABC-type glycerol-3-phosphate transport system substrate-binding protein
LHPAIEQSVGPTYAANHAIPAVVRRGASTSQLEADAREGRSEWDVFVGITPFLDIAGLAESQAIVPWDEFVPRTVVADLHPAIRRESSLDGKLYSWPFLVDVVVQGWNVDFVSRAGLDPGRPPETWDEYVANAREVQRTGAAPYGCTLDVRAWRSLVPIAHTFETDVYTEDGLFDYTHDAVVNALEIQRSMVELANPDVLDPSTTAGSGATTDEGAFASQLAGYYVKYTNALLRGANTWPDPARLAMSSVPGLQDEEGGVTVWSVGLALPRHGASRRAAAEYAETLTYDRRIWRDSIETGRQSVGQIAGYRSLWAEWSAEEPPWVPEWASSTFRELRRAVTIKPHRLGARQFTLAQPHLNRYLAGEEKSARRTLRRALVEVRKAAS